MPCVDNVSCAGILGSLAKKNMKNNQPPFHLNLCNITVTLLGQKLVTWTEDILYICANATSKSSNIWLFSGYSLWICHGSGVNVGLSVWGRCTAWPFKDYGVKKPLTYSGLFPRWCLVLFTVIWLFRVLSLGKEANFFFFESRLAAMVWTEEPFCSKWYGL